jgi:DNA-binding NarL/FixJ family response regulator
VHRGISHVNHTITDRVIVDLHADDPISRAGVASHLRTRPEIRLAEQNGPEPPQVVVVVVDVIDDDVLRLLRQVQRTTSARGVLVVTHVDEQQLVNAAECGFVGIVRRSEATPERMVQVIGAVAKGEGYVPPDLLGSLLTQVGRVQGQILEPRGLNFTGLAAREVEVLRLVAAGRSNRRIAEELYISPKTASVHVSRIIAKLAVSNRGEAAALAHRLGLLDSA